MGGYAKMLTAYFTSIFTSKSLIFRYKIGMYGGD